MFNLTNNLSTMNCLICDTCVTDTTQGCRIYDEQGQLEMIVCQTCSINSVREWKICGGKEYYMPYNQYFEQLIELHKKPKLIVKG